MDMGVGLELYGLHKDGHEFPVEISLSPLQTAEGVLITSAIRDIAERKQAELSLRDLSGRLLQLQDEERRRIARELHDSAGQGYHTAAPRDLVDEPVLTSPNFLFPIPLTAAVKVTTTSTVIHAL